MNRPTDRPLDDRELEAYLRRESQVSQQYRELPEEEVPAHLDALILDQARAALRNQSANAARDDLAGIRQRRRRLMRWSVPAALAASALLVVSIVIRSGVQHETLQLPQVRQEAPGAAPRTAPAGENAAAAAPVRDAAPPGFLPESAEETTSKESEEARAAAQNTQESRAQRESLVNVAPATRSTRQSDVPFEMPPPPVPAALSPQVAEPTVTGQAIHAPAPAPADDARVKAAAGTPQPTSAEDLDEIAVTGYRAARKRRAAGPHDTVRTNASSSAPQAPSVSETYELPEPWLEHIRQLRRDGEQREADREWRRFRERYPDYAVAADDPARAER